ncbi:MAG: methyltransferase domain-containing protein [Hyphomicrobiaceae bacterium]
MTTARGANRPGPQASAHHPFDRSLLVTRRNRAAPQASAHDFLLHRASDDIAERLAIIQRNFPVAVVLGAHHGVLGRRLRALPNVGLVIETETSTGLLARCDGPRLLADEEVLPFADGSLDLVASALTLHHVNDLPGTLAQIRRALRPDGLFIGAMLGGQTLSELRTVMIAAESEGEDGASPHVAPFADVRDAGALLQRAGFALPVADSDTVAVTYESALSLMRDLRGMGATNVLTSRRRTPMRRATLLRACELYQDRFSDSHGRVTATFEVITMTAWAPHSSQQQPLRPGSATARLADALRTPELPAGEAVASPEDKDEDTGGAR